MVKLVNPLKQILNFFIKNIINLNSNKEIKFLKKIILINIFFEFYIKLKIYFIIGIFLKFKTFFIYYAYSTSLLTIFIV
jgi:hypothetical protein